MPFSIVAGRAAPYTKTIMSMREAQIEAAGTDTPQANNHRSSSKRSFFCGVEIRSFFCRFEFGCALPFLGNQPEDDFNDIDVEQGIRDNLLGTVPPALATEPPALATVPPALVTELPSIATEPLSDPKPVTLGEPTEWGNDSWATCDPQEAGNWDKDAKSYEIQRPDHNIKNRVEANKLTEEGHRASAVLARLEVADKLGDELEEDLRNLVVDNFTAHELLDEAMKVLKNSFLETSRVHWRPLWGSMKKGRHLVDTSMTGMGGYFRSLDSKGLLDILPRTRDLRTLMVEHNNITRNQLAHPDYEYFASSSEVELRLQIMQAAILIMGDHDRFAKLRALRDQLAEETKRVMDKVLAMGRQAQDPTFEISEDDMEFLDDWDVRFSNILSEEARFDGHRLESDDPMLCLARWYSKRCRTSKRCHAYANGNPEFW